jgi:aspartate-semialdehyde dehydrogenase
MSKAEKEKKSKLKANEDKKEKTKKKNRLSSKQLHLEEAHLKEKSDKKSNQITKAQDDQSGYQATYTVESTSTAYEVKPLFVPKLSTRPIHVAIVGATGAVGRELIEAFQQNQLDIADLKLYASERSAGDTIEFKGKELMVEDLSMGSWKKAKLDVAFFSAGSPISLEYVPQFVEHGILVIDNTSAFRMRADVPLIVPEVNIDQITTHKGIISNPNCSTIEAMPVLHTLEKCYGLKRVVYSTYQSASGAGKSGMDELQDQTVALLNFKTPVVKKFPKRLAFDLIPKIGSFLEDGNTQEEEKMIKESQKILNLPDLPVSATCVRVPTFIGHCLSVNVELKQQFDLEALIDQLKKTQNIQVFTGEEYPTLMDANGLDIICVGRIRRDSSVPYGVNLWIVADNLRKGASTNAWQIAQAIYGTPKSNIQDLSD